MVDMCLLREIMEKCGWNPMLNGTRFLRTAVKLYDPDSSLMELYGSVAFSHDTTDSRVERCIRNSVEDVFKNGDVDELHKVFGGQIRAASGKMTNGSVIASLWYKCGGDND